MAFIVQILIGLLTIFIGFILGSTWQISRRRLSYLRARRFWRPFLSADLQIVIGRFQEFNAFEASGFVGVGDMQAAAEIAAFFDDLGLRRSGHTASIVYHDRLAGDLYGANLICIGGPDANKVTDRILGRINHTIKLGDPRQHEIFLHDAETGEIYSPKVERDSENREVIASDYGLLVKAPNPYDSHRSTMIFAGSFGYGTWGGVKLTRMSEFLRAKLVRRGAAVECLYKVEILEEMPQRPEIVLMRQVLNISLF